MHLINAFKLYICIHNKVHGVGKIHIALTLNDAILELMHHNLQAGPNMRRQVAEHPPPKMDIVHVFNSNGGRRERAD